MIHDMVRVTGGPFTMGTDAGYPEERPPHSVHVDDFWLDVHPVTNDQFAVFVDETGWITAAERPPDPAQFPGIDPALCVPGSAVFARPDGPVDPNAPYGWWAYVAGADWRHPWGTDSSIAGLGDHPVAHVAFEDAAGYAAWSGLALPTEAQWEFAALAGNDHDTRGRLAQPPSANVWHGLFPWQRADGLPPLGTTPVGSYGANALGLVDLLGNVWEWTSDWFTDAHELPASPCCAPRNPLGPSGPTSFDAALPTVPLRVAKGGSFLCAANYCARYRPAARLGQAVDTSTVHVGFRCARPA